ncbi:UNVERIFIED_CONTAM: hypothetical protein Scaly_1880500 [Sesamum calycinum]|uniref:Uncharacterized protein n=1 Tax=Sesamum calycinum TaxID=2727403 RepID=A0AAW2NF60_9LAMI
MGSASYDEASQKALEDDLVDAGDRLLALPSSTDELLILLGIEELPMSKQASDPRKEKEKVPLIDHGVNLKYSFRCLILECMLSIQNPRRSRVDYGEELINLRIQVWWPMDEMTQEKTAKGKAGSLRKQNAASSSKRSKSENRSIIKNSVPDIIHLNDESNDETNVFRRDDGEHLADKEE